jgi:hypothetical protein
MARCQMFGVGFANHTNTISTSSMGLAHSVHFRAQQLNLMLSSNSLGIPHGSGHFVPPCYPSLLQSLLRSATIVVACTSIVTACAGYHESAYPHVTRNAKNSKHCGSAFRRRGRQPIPLV